MNSSKTIIEKSISELKTQKISLEKEVISLDSAICTLENLISKTNIIENVKHQVNDIGAIGRDKARYVKSDLRRIGVNV